jgi:hypothetical protein
MTDLNTIRVIPFCGNADEWPICNEKFMAKAKRYGFKDTLTRKLSIPKADEEFDKDSDMGKKTSSHKTWFSRRHQMQRSLRMPFGFVIVVQVHTIVLQIEACLMLKTSMRTFVLEMGIS